MRILDFQYSELILKPIGPRLYVLAKDAWIVLRIKGLGDVEILLQKGFKFNARSGTALIDYFIPHIGSQILLACWAVHDALGHDFGFSFETVNDFLDQMLELAGETDFKSDIVEGAVSILDGWYGCKTDAEYENRTYIRVHWVHSSPLYKVSKPKLTRHAPGMFGRFWAWLKR